MFTFFVRKNKIYKSPICDKPLSRYNEYNNKLGWFVDWGVFNSLPGLLTDDTAVYTEDNKGNPEYSYQYIDALYDFLLSINVKPFVELEFMQSRLAIGSQTIFL